MSFLFGPVHFYSPPRSATLKGTSSDVATVAILENGANKDQPRAASQVSAPIAGPQARDHETFTEVASQTSFDEVPLQQHPEMTRPSKNSARPAKKVRFQIESGTPFQSPGMSTELTLPEHTSEATQASDSSEKPWDGSLGDGQWAVDRVTTCQTRGGGAIWYKVEWAGVHPDTGEKYDSDWLPEEDVGKGAKAQYHARRRARLRKRRRGGY